MKGARTYDRTRMVRLAIRFVRLMESDVRPSAPQIASALGVSRRTACRWIAAANEVHLPMPPSVDQVAS